MKVVADQQTLQVLAAVQCGVFTIGDLQVAFAEPNRAAIWRRIDALIETGLLRRFCRGIYVTESFDPLILCQRLGPNSVVSFETVLARNLVIGVDPQNRIRATQLGRPRTFSGLGIEIEFFRLTPSLAFGWEVVNGVRIASAEKAVLDVLYFHLRGAKYAFDLYSDMNLSKLDPAVLGEYLQSYRNPKFVSFAKNLLQLS
jgi:hypothetical protein